MKKYLFLILLIIFIPNVYADTFVTSAKYIKCIDGDTAYFSINNVDTKVRFISIDAPEVDTNEFMSNEAKEYVCNNLENASKIELEIEIRSEKDKYDRTLAWIWIDGKLLQESIIENGYAKVAYVYGNYRYSDALCIIERQVMSKGVGIWQTDTKAAYCFDSYSDNYDEIDYANIGLDTGFELGKRELTNSEKLDEISDISDKISDIISSKQAFIIIIVIVFSFMLIHRYKKNKPL